MWYGVAADEWIAQPTTHADIRVMPNKTVADSFLLGNLAWITSLPLASVLAKALDGAIYLMARCGTFREEAKTVCALDCRVVSLSKQHAAAIRCSEGSTTDFLTSPSM